MSKFQRLENGNFVYPMSLNGKGEVLLPRTQKGDVYLAWLERPEILDLAVAAFVDLLVDILSESGIPSQVLLITPPSGKSETMMDLVLIELSKRLPDTTVRLFKPFAREKRVNPDDLDDGKKTGLEKLRDELGEDAVIVDYNPITDPKHIGISAENSENMREVFEQEDIIAFIIDDVFSTGATVEAMRELLNQVIGRELSLPAVVLALELFVDENFDSAQLHDPEKNVFAVGKIPVELVDIAA